ncbi:hypothetical protein MKW92_043069 [Papaver armeniacum]|nr:hypothetical protein MKW92_022524 [Papaver armeniacum]KAI3946680.1 hypothetical protein MKW92_043069 [Papaver armeniacum]
MSKNPNSIGEVTVDADNDFKSCFLAFDSYLKGLKDGCRTFVGFDGCHLRGKCGGVMLSAVALDSNNGMC